MRIGNSLISPYELVTKIWPDVLSPLEMKKLSASLKFKNAHFWASVIVAGVDKNQPKSAQSKSVKKAMRADILFLAQSEINKFLAGSNYISYAAGVSAVIFTLEVAKLKEKGVYPPEALDKNIAEAIVERIKKFGVKIEIKEVS